MSRLRSQRGAAGFGAPGRVEIAVRVIPRARKTEVVGFRDDELVVRVAALPVEGAANDALIAFLSSAFHVPRRAVQILSGDRGRRKRVAIDGVTAAQIPWSRTS